MADADTPVETILAHIQTVGDLYHRLILVVGPSGTRKTAALRAVAANTGVPVMNLSLELSRRLLDLTERRRALEVPGALDEILGRDTALVLLDNTEICSTRLSSRIPSASCSTRRATGRSLHPGTERSTTATCTPRTPAILTTVDTRQAVW